MGSSDYRGETIATMDSAVGRKPDSHGSFEHLVGAQLFRTPRQRSHGHGVLRRYCRCARVRHGPGSPRSCAPSKDRDSQTTKHHAACTDTDLRASEQVRLGSFCADIDWCVLRNCMCRVGAPVSMAARWAIYPESECLRQRVHTCTGPLHNAHVPPCLEVGNHVPASAELPD
jgi:hypothetical protein